MSNEDKFDYVEKIVNNPDTLRKTLLDFDRKLTELYYSEKRNFLESYEISKDINEILFIMNDCFKSELLENLIYRGINSEIYFLGFLKNKTRDYVEERLSNITSKISLLNNPEKNNELKNKIKLLKDTERVCGNCENKKYPKDSKETNLDKNRSLRLNLEEINKANLLYLKLLPYVSELKNEENVREIFDMCTQLKKNSDFSFRLYDDLKSEIIEQTLYSNLKIEVEYLKLVEHYNKHYFMERIFKLRDELKCRTFFNVGESEKLINNLEFIAEPEKVSKEDRIEKNFGVINAYHDVFKTSKNLPSWTLKLCLKSAKDSLDSIYLETKIGEILKNKERGSNEKNTLEKDKLKFAFKGTELMLDMINETIKRREEFENNSEIQRMKKIYENFLKILEDFKD